MRPWFLQGLIDLESNMSLLLIKAASGNKIEIVRNLIKSSYNLNERNEIGQTALIVATIAGYFEVVRLLLESGGNPNSTDEFGQSALMYAVVNKDLEIVELLLKYGAKVDLRDFNGRTVLDMAKVKSFSLQCGAMITSIEFSYWWKESEILKILKKYKKKDEK